MAILHIASTGSATAPYETWAKAGTNFVTVLAAAAAGDTIYVHNEAFTAAADTTLVNSGTHTAPIIILSVDKASETDGTTCTYTPGASFKTSGGVYHLYYTDVVYTYGVDYVAGNDFRVGESHTYWRFEDCQCGLGGTDVGDRISSYISETQIDFINVEFTFGNIFQTCGFGDGSKVSMIGCSIDPAGSAVQKFISNGGSRGTNLLIENCDFTNLATSGTVLGSSIIPGNWSKGSTIFLNNCKLPTSGTVNDANTTSRAALIEARACATTSQPSAIYVHQYEGTATDDTSTYLDTDSAWSLKCVASTDSLEVYHPLRVMLGEVYAAANSTIRVEGMVDLVTLPNDDEIWIEIEYPDATVTNWRKSYSSRGPLNAAPTILDASTLVTWVEAVTNNNEFYIETTLTSGAGIHTIWVNVANASGLTAWFDSKVIIS